jgi:hypothetical protein
MPASDPQLITPNVIEEAMSYDSFLALIDERLKQGKTTGAKQSDELTEYTRLNRQRIKRLDKAIKLNDSLKEKLADIQGPWTWLVLAEGWCGDVAQNVPAIHKMAEAAPNVTLKLLLRTENTDIMDRYLTNGGRSIPKLVCLQADTLEENGTWGPRPETFQRQAMQWKDDPDISHREWAEKLHKWYNEDQSQAIQSDFESLIEEWS